MPPHDKTSAAGASGEEAVSVKSSEVLERIARKAEQAQELSVGQLVEALGERGFGLGILIFALPNSFLLPGVPLVSSITSVPIFLFSFQLLCGADKLYMPERIAERPVPGGTGFPRLIQRTLPALRWLEQRLFKPRLRFMTHHVAEKLLALLVLALAILLFLPIPMGNFLPGIALTLIALGLLEEDGLAMLGGAAIGVISFVAIGSLVKLGAQEAQQLFYSWF